MIPYLKQVADHYFAAGEIGRRCFIFPNRRSMAFFRKYLSECVASRGVKAPFIEPTLLSVSDFFYRAYGVEPTDRLGLLLALYDSYRKIYPRAELLDEFIFWGDIILSDFDDIDKYLVDARLLLTNVSDFKGMQDTLSYLSETQRKAVEQFVRHFRKDAARLTVALEGGSDDIKTRFLQIWNLLYPLYEDFRSSLRSKGMAYEGMVYRDLAEKLKEKPVTDVLEGLFDGVTSYVFVGLNTLSTSERTVLLRMKKAGIAEFTWDYEGKMIRDPRNRSSHFLRENLSDFGEAFPLVKEEGIPEFEVIRVPSSVGQAKLLPEILRTVDLTDPVRTAIVLPDENLLLPVLNSIPPEAGKINVTMGYPLSGSDIYMLMSSVSALQLHLRQKKGSWQFYHRQVHAIFSSSIFRSLLTPAEEEAVANVSRDLKYYVDVEDLRKGPLTERIFRPVVKDLTTPSADVVLEIVAYQRDILGFIGAGLSEREDLALELDFVKRYYTVLNVFSSLSLEILPVTYFRLLEQHLATVAVPFNGEPLGGLQVMGPLETRALDFDNLIILSANEGTFPRRSVSSSFVPPELRKGFDMPTYEHQDAMWAYYFYRMIQRPKKVWLISDSRTEGLRSGEESRFIRQLEYHFHVPLHRKVAAAPLKLLSAEDSLIPKTEEDVAKIRSRNLSATSLKNYLDCPAKFYYGFVKELKTDDEVTETLDAIGLGNVYHKAMEILYTREDKTLTRQYVLSLIKDKERIRTLVRDLILENLSTDEVAGRDLVVEDVIIQYILKTLERDAEYLEGKPDLRILGLERKFYWNMDGFRFTGTMDRLDSFADGTVRVVDYKTGSVSEKEFEVREGQEEEVAGQLFDPEAKDRPKIALQMFLYDVVAREISGVEHVLNSIYSPSDLFVHQVQDHEINAKFASLVREGLSGTLSEMVDTSIPFRRTDVPEHCEWCDFKMICGR